MTDEEADDKSCEDNDQGVGEEVDRVIINVGRPEIRITRKSPSDHLNSFAKESQYSSVHEEASSEKSGATRT